MKRGEQVVNTVKDAGGIRIIALLVANASRSIHALDLHAALEKRPPALGPLGELRYSSGDLTVPLRALGLSVLSDAKLDVDLRLRACLRELDRVSGSVRAQLLAQMKAELRQRRLNLTAMPYVRNIVAKLRKQAGRALTALGGDAVQPLVSAVEIGELSSYQRA